MLATIMWHLLNGFQKSFNDSSDCLPRLDSPDLTEKKLKYKLTQTLALNNPYFFQIFPISS